MERIIGYDRVILIDSLATGQHPLGQVSRLTLGEMPDHATGHTTAAHDTSLITALSVGRQMGAILPALDNIWVVGIEAEHVYDFSDILSPSIARAIPIAVEMVLTILKE